MFTISLINRVDIEMLMGWKYPMWYNFHCYKFGDNYIYHYRFYHTWWKAFLFLFGYESKPE